MARAGWLLYGATGYTGGLIAREAVRRGARPVLGGRDAVRLARLAAELGLEHRVAPIEALAPALAGLGAVVHAAGPFATTAAPVADACLEAGVHYLDLSGEVSAVLAVAERDQAARARGVMLLPSVGFDAVATNCLAAHVAGRLRGACHLAIGIAGLELLSRGSARSSVRQLGRPLCVRRGGALAELPAGSLRRDFDYGRGPSASVGISWVDVVAAWYATGIPDIEAYVEETSTLRWLGAMNRGVGWAGQLPLVNEWMDWQAGLLPPGPSDADRAGRHATVVAEVRDGAGRIARARLVTPEVYGFSAETAVALVARVLGGDLEPGFQTPARVYGPDLVLGFPGVRREDLDPC
jgi:short subunit dehydrogenase-like uncharacterized protein